MRSSAVLSIVGLALSGCVALPIPNDRLATPVVAGTVVDAISKAPLPGARILARSPHGGTSGTTTSDASGQYKAFASTRALWYFFTPLNFEGICEGSFTVEKDGYKSFTFVESYFGWGGNNGLCSWRPIPRQIELDRSEVAPADAGSRTNDPKGTPGEHHSPTAQTSRCLPLAQLLRQGGGPAASPLRRTLDANGRTG